MISLVKNDTKMNRDNLLKNQFLYIKDSYFISNNSFFLLVNKIEQLFRKIIL